MIGCIPTLLWVSDAFVEVWHHHDICLESWLTAWDRGLFVYFGY